MEEFVLSGERAEELGIDNLKILQSEELYRFTSDAVLLSRFASAKKREKVADLCSGSGIVGLHYYALHPETVESVSMFELQSALADMSRRSVCLNGLEDKIFVYNTPLQEIGGEFNGAFTLALCNPPYERRGSGEGSLTESDRIARHEVAITLDEIVGVAAKKLTFGGRLCMCHRADRLVDVLYNMRSHGIEPKRLSFTASSEKKPPYLVFVEGVLGGKPGLKIEPPIKN